ncbi:MotA/TolQ/ExbB proton channel family protein, partial [bacterium]|nr:MotA/TolQ/ExbB proton channel family protein [bacterium]
SESMLALGMIGTVAGFILMLGGSFSDIDTSNPETLKTALKSMALGMSTALYTTLVGLVCSQLYKVQLVILESMRDEQ